MNTNYGLSKPKEKTPTEDVSKEAIATIPVCLPYLRGLLEKLSHIFREHEISTYHKACEDYKVNATFSQGQVSRQCQVWYHL